MKIQLIDKLTHPKQIVEPKEEKAEHVNVSSEVSKMV
jgi:hypothetical protein